MTLNRISLATSFILLAACTMSRSVQSPKAVPQSASTNDALRTNHLREEMQSWAAANGTYLRRTWGVDVVGVRLVSSDWMLQFKYKVIDPVKAVPLLDLHVKPYLVDEASGARLAVPAMENVGELRQHTDPDPNRIYFMIFGNADKIVPRGGRVSVVIGQFQASGLPVQ